MERTQLFDLMGELKLFGMKAAFDEIMATAVKRQHEPQRIVGDLLNAEISEKQARSIKYQLTIAKLPLAKDLDDFQFEDTPINETLVNDLAGGGFIAQQRNAVLVGGTGTGKTHLAIAIARSCIRGGARGRFYNVVDLVNRLETETRAGRQGRLAEPPDPHGLHYPRRTWLSALCSIRRATPIPSRQPALRTHLNHRHHEPRVRGVAECLQGTSNNTRFRRFVLAERAECGARAKVSPRSGAGLTLGRRVRGPLHDATQTPPVSALKRVQPPSARAEPAGGYCSQGSSSRS